MFARTTYIQGTSLGDWPQAHDVRPLPRPTPLWSHHFWFRSIFIWCRKVSACNYRNGWPIFWLLNKMCKDRLYYCCCIGCVWNGQFLAPHFRKEIRAWKLFREGPPGWFLFWLLCSIKNGWRTWTYFGRKKSPWERESSDTWSAILWQRGEFVWWRLIIRSLAELLENVS